MKERKRIRVLIKVCASCRSDLGQKSRKWFDRALGIPLWIRVDPSFSGSLEMEMVWAMVRRAPRVRQTQTCNPPRIHDSVPFTTNDSFSHD